MKRLSRFRTCAAALAAVMTLQFAAPRPAYAVQPDEILSDAKLEARARQLSAGLRCLVCQNQSIDDSDAPLAKDLRVLVRERLVAGDTDSQVTDYVVSRYGEYVLLKPPLGWHTLLLWLIPVFALGGAAWAVTRAQRLQPASRSPMQISAEEKAALDRLADKSAGPDAKA